MLLVFSVLVVAIGGVASGYILGYMHAMKMED